MLNDAGKWLDMYGILHGCPVGDRCMECPLSEIDDLTFKERIAWFEKLSENRKDDILHNHTICSVKR